MLLVSHDRVFLDNIVTSTLAFEGEGGVTEYVGGYEDYLRQHGSRDSGSGPARRSFGRDERPGLDACRAAAADFSRDEGPFVPEALGTGAANERERAPARPGKATSTRRRSR